MDITRTYPKPHPQTAGRVFDGEAVLILADRSEINVLNQVGALIFELADGQHAVTDIVTAITSQFKVGREEAEQDTIGFLEELAQLDVLVLEQKG